MKKGLVMHLEALSGEPTYLYLSWIITRSQGIAICKLWKTDETISIYLFSELGSMKLNLDFSELHYSASKMIAGTLIPIYQKPMTLEEFEGEAELVEFIGFDPDTNMQTWNVKFEDGHVVQRKILIEV